MKNLAAVQLGRKGGQSKSPRKLAAILKNLSLARARKALKDKALQPSS